MKVHCHTTLDLRGEGWPTDLPSVPNVGDKIESSSTWQGGFRLTLRVVDVRWKKEISTAYYKGEWYPEIELHDSWPVPRSIKDFYE